MHSYSQNLCLKLVYLTLFFCPQLQALVPSEKTLCFEPKDLILSNSLGCFEHKAIVAMQGVGIIAYDFDEEKIYPLTEDKSLDATVLKSVMIAPHGRNVLWRVPGPNPGQMIGKLVVFPERLDVKKLTIKPSIDELGFTSLGTYSSNGQFMIQRYTKNATEKSKDTVSSLRLSENRKDSLVFREGPILDKNFSRITISSSGQQILYVISNSLFLYDATKGHKKLSDAIRVVEGKEGVDFLSPHFSSDGKKILVTLQKGAALINLEGKEKVVTSINFKDSGSVTLASFFKDQWMATLTGDGKSDGLFELFTVPGNSSVTKKAVPASIKKYEKRIAGFDEKAIVHCDHEFVLVKILDKVCRIKHPNPLIKE